MAVVGLIFIVSLMMSFSLGKFAEDFRRRNRFSKQYGSAWVNFQKFRFGLFLKIAFWAMVGLMILVGFLAG